MSPTVGPPCGTCDAGLATGAELTPFEKASLAVGGAFLALWLLTLVLAIIVLALAATG
jgi:hypothetical protein